MGVINTIPFVAHVLDGKILDKPKKFYIDCNNIRILGMNRFRDLDRNECVIQMYGFTIWYNGMIMANKDFNRNSFIAYRDANCKPCGRNVPVKECGLMLNGCFVTLNGCRISLN